MSIAFNPRPRRPRFSPVACSPVLGALGAVDLAPSWFAEEDALEVCIARTARHRRAVSALLRWLTYAAAAVTAAVLLFVVGYILVRGVPALTPDLFQWEYTSENVSLLPALASTVIMALLALAMAVPVGVGAAIYLVEYARRGSRFVRLVRVTAETLFIHKNSAIYRIRKIESLTGSSISAGADAFDLQMCLLLGRPDVSYPRTAPRMSGDFVLK